MICRLPARWIPKEFSQKVMNQLIKIGLGVWTGVLFSLVWTVLPLWGLTNWVSSASTASQFVVSAGFSQYMKYVGWEAMPLLPYCVGPAGIMTRLVRV